MTTVKEPDGAEFNISFTEGMPPSGLDSVLFLMRDGSLMSGALVWVKDDQLSEGGSRWLRTTNPTGGLHHVYHLPVTEIIGYRYAGPQWPSSKDVGSTY